MTRKISISVALASTALALSATMAFLSPAGAQGTCSVSSDDQSVDVEEQRMLGLINEYRATNGLNSLRLDAALTRAAAWFSRDMATKNYFPPNHVDSLGRDPGTRVTQCGAAWTEVHENIAAGRESAELTFEQWRTSPSHNTAMLAPGVSLAGIGRAFDAASVYRWYWTLELTAPASTDASFTTTTLAPTLRPLAPTVALPTSTSTSTTASTTSTTLAPPPPPLPPPPLPSRTEPPPLPTATPGAEPSTIGTPTPTTDIPLTIGTPAPAMDAPAVPPAGDTCGMLLARQAETNAQITDVVRSVSGSLGGPELHAVTAWLEQLRVATNGHMDALRADAGCSAAGPGGLDVTTAATAS